MVLKFHYFVIGPTTGSRCGRPRSVRRGVSSSFTATGQWAHSGATRGRGGHRARIRERDQGAPRAVPEEHRRTYGKGT